MAAFEPASVRFARRVGPADARGCREWLGSRNSGGYGQFWDGSRMVKAHRFAYILVNGALPPDAPLVLHSCDNPPCCEPSHLRPGTDDANTRDKLERGRINPARREANGRAKLDEGAVTAIRRLYARGRTQMQIAAEFGLGQSHVSRIVRGESWK